MKSSLDTWSSSISSILQKTESNLTKTRHSKSDFFQKKDLIYSEPSISITEANPSSPNDIPALSLQDFYIFKSQISERLLKQDQELERLKKHFSTKDRQENGILGAREEINSALNAIEKKCLNEVKKLTSLVNKNTEMHMQFQEELRKDFIESQGFSGTSIRKLEESLKAIKKEIVENQQMGEELRNQLRRIGDISEVKVRVLREVERIKVQAKEDFEEFYKGIEVFKEGIQKSIRREMDKIDKKFKEEIKEIAEISEQNLNMFQEITQKFASLKASNQEISTAVQKLQKTRNKIKQFQEKQGKFEMLLGKLPDFKDFCKNSEIRELLETLSQHQRVTVLLQDDLKQVKETLKTFSEYAKRSELDEQIEQLTKKLELIKIALTGKPKFEKFKKQIIHKLKDPTRYSTGSMKNTEKLSDSVINKLVQIEQRVCVLEDLYENDSALATPEERLNKEREHTSSVNNSKDFASSHLSKQTYQREDSDSSIFEGVIGEELLAMETVNSPYSIRRLSERQL